MRATNLISGMKHNLLRILLIISLMAGATALSSCEDDTYNERWYLSGTWQCMQYPDETLCFYMDGTGHWENNYNGDYEEFDYYCNGSYLYFQWYPMFGPSYSENCSIFMTNNNAMQITYPSSSGYGPVTLYYSRIN